MMFFIFNIYEVYWNIIFCDLVKCMIIEYDCFWSKNSCWKKVEDLDFSLKEVYILVFIIEWEIIKNDEK